MNKHYYIKITKLEVLFIFIKIKVLRFENFYKYIHIKNYTLSNQV